MNTLNAEFLSRHSVVLERSLFDSVVGFDSDVAVFYLAAVAFEAYGA